MPKQRIFTEAERDRHADLLETATRTGDPEEKQALDEFEQRLLPRLKTAYEKGEVDPMPIVEALRGVNRGLATKKIDEMKDIYQPFLFAAFSSQPIDGAPGESANRIRAERAESVSLGDALDFDHRLASGGHYEFRV